MKKLVLIFCIVLCSGFVFGRGTPMRGAPVNPEDGVRLVDMQSATGAVVSAIINGTVTPYNSARLNGNTSTDFATAAEGALAVSAVQPNDSFIFSLEYTTNTTAVSSAIGGTPVLASSSKIQGYGCLSTFSGDFNKVIFPYIANVSNNWDSIVCEVRSLTYAGTERQDLENSTLLAAVTNTLQMPSQNVYTNVTFILPRVITASDINDALVCAFYCMSNNAAVGWAGRSQGTMGTRIDSKHGAYYYEGAGLIDTSSSNYWQSYYLVLDEPFTNTTVTFKDGEYVPEGVEIIFNDSYLCDGIEGNIYFDNLIAGDWKDYYWDVACNVGTQQVERWTYTPNGHGSLTTEPITISCYDKETRRILDSVTGTVYISPSSSGTSASLLMIGDSTTAHQRYPAEVFLLGLSDSINFSMIGTVQNTVQAGAWHEGYSGKTISWMCSDPASPFYNSGSFDFSNYLTSNGLSTPEYVIINLGINSMWTYTDDVGVDERFASDKVYYDQAIASIHAVDSSIKIGIGVTQPPSYYQDAFGANYGSGSSKMHIKHNIIHYGKLLSDEYKGREWEKIYVVPVNQSLDTVNNMSTVTVAVNARNSTTVTRQSNGVHPAESGYGQLADALFSWIKVQEN